MAHEHVKGVLSSGEVVLVDTRQHWMALIRYALKPILLIGLSVLLVALNQWLVFDGFLEILNQLIRIVLVVAFLAAIVWLPIDVVRWFSRHYVLTNRRAMRMDGVFRKRSFDSSLEQINDIGMSQTIFGRTFGYADLTLYTASDTANESYEQLLDGPQFKKAVLDAKADGYRNLVSACGDQPGMAPTLLMIEKVTEVVAEQVKAIQNLQIDKITVWDSGAGSNDGRGGTAGFLSGLMGALPPMQELARQAGIELPGYLGRIKEAEPADDPEPTSPEEKQEGTASA